MPPARNIPGRNTGRPSAPAGSDATWARQAGAVTAAAAPPRGAPADQLLDWAEATGRLLARERDTHAGRLAADPATYDPLIRILAPSEFIAQRNVAARSGGVAASRAGSPPAQVLAATPAVRAASGPGVAVSQTASGLDVSSLPPQLQAAAAREPDRVVVYRWIERFAGAGATPETQARVSPEFLELMGEVSLAAGVRRYDADVAAAAEAEQSAAFKAANEAWSRQQFENHYQSLVALGATGWATDRGAPDVVPGSAPVNPF